MHKEKHIRQTAEQLIGQGNFDEVELGFTSNYITPSENKEYKGRDFIKYFILHLRTAIPDIKINNIQVLTENGNNISWIRSLQGTHETDMMGIPASGKKIIWNGW